MFQCAQNVGKVLRGGNKIVNVSNKCLLARDLSVCAVQDYNAGSCVNTAKCAANYAVTGYASSRGKLRKTCNTHLQTHAHTRAHART